MKKVINILLIFLTMQLSFDETLSHFDLSGHVDLNGNSTFASVNAHLQKCHDHLWVTTAISDLTACQGQSHSTAIFPAIYTLPDFYFAIWQPPKIH